MPFISYLEYCPDWILREQKSQYLQMFVSNVERSAIDGYISFSPSRKRKIRAFALGHKPMFSLRIPFPIVPNLQHQSLSLPTNTMAPNFFSLPRELRNQIYSHLWHATPVLTLSKDKSLTAWYAHRPLNLQLVRGPVHIGLPAWLLTNKRVLREGVEEFHIEGIIALDGSGAGLAGGGTVLSASTAREVHITMVEVADEGLGETSLHREVDANGVVRLGEMVDGGKTKMLKIYVDLAPRANVPQTMNLAPLGVIEHLESLRRVELVVQDRELNGTARSTLEPCLLKEVRELGREAFGGWEAKVNRQLPPMQLPAGFVVPGYACTWRFVWENK
jgi:hypothetical protein